MQIKGELMGARKRTKDEECKSLERISISFQKIKESIVAFSLSCMELGIKVVYKTSVANLAT